MDNFLKYAIRTLLIIFALVIAIPAYSGDASDALIDENGTIEGIFAYKSTSEPRSTFSSSIKRSSRDGKVFCKITERGRGDYDKYEDVTWDSVAEIREEEDFLYIIYSTQIIKDKGDNILVKYEKHFDYNKEKIYYTASDGEGNIIKERTLLSKLAK